MEDLFSTIRRAGFGGIEFPYTDYSIRGSLRHHVHEYIKRPGAEVESLSRRAYEFSFKCRFVDVFEAYVDLYPSRLSALISLCEQGLAQDLWVPTMGRSFKCKALTWVRNVSAQMRSGEDVEFSFLEDSSEEFTTLNLIGLKTAAFTPKVVLLTDALAALEDRSWLDFLDDLLGAINAFLTAVDIANSYIDYALAKIDAVIGACIALANLPVMQRAPSAVALRALLEIWAIAAQQRAQVVAAARPIVSYVVDRAYMSVIDVSISLYNSPSRASEILRLNDLDNALAIPRGTLVRYFAA